MTNIKYALLSLCLPWLLYAQDCCDYKQKSDDCIGLTLWADGLYWQAREDGLAYAIQNNNGAFRINNGYVRRMDFDWHGGFRLGAGYCTPCGYYVVNAYWTRFHTKSHDCLNVTYPTTLFSVWTNPSSMITSEDRAIACAYLDLDMADARVTALCTPHERIDIMPYIGFVYARINQHMNIDMSGGQSNAPFATVLGDVICMKNNFKGVGPKVGLTSIWNVASGFSLFSRADAALTYGTFNIYQNETIAFSNNVPQTTVLHIPCNKFHMTRPILDVIIGARWDKPLNRDAFCCASRYHVYVEAGWELMYFFGQNMLMRFVDDINPAANLEVHGDLATQGLTARVSFNF